MGVALPTGWVTRGTTDLPHGGVCLAQLCLEPGHLRPEPSAGVSRGTLDAKAKQGGIRTGDLFDELVASLEPAFFSRAHGGDPREISRGEGEEVAVDDAVESEEGSGQLHAAARPHARRQRRVQANEEQSALVAGGFEPAGLFHARQYGPA